MLYYITYRKFHLRKKGGTYMKKIISVLLAIVMCFTMTTVAFAADEETPEVSKDDIISVLLEAAKIASDLNDEARKKLSEELEKLIIEKIAGDSEFLQGAAEWVLDKVIGLSGADNLLDIDREQAEKIADLLTKMYDGNLADAVDSPILKLVINTIPEEMLKEAVVWILSDGFGDALDEFIKEYGGESGEETPDAPPAADDGAQDGIFADLDIVTVISAAFKALSDVITELINQISALINTQPAA